RSPYLSTCYTHTHTHTHAHTHTHTCTHTHTHTHTGLLFMLYTHTHAHTHTGSLFMLKWGLMASIQQEVMASRYDLCSCSNMAFHQGFTFFSKTASRG